MRRFRGDVVDDVEAVEAFEPVEAVELTPDSTEYEGVAYVNYSEGLNIRKDPEMKSDNVIEVVKYMTRLNYCKDDKGSTWVRVTTPSGSKGFAMSKFLSM